MILGFNQKKFLGQAIDAALAQDYRNLQVLLSDDGSTDGSFEIMQARAAAYRGPHRVRAIRTPRNFGLIHHLLYASGEADGDLIVVAAGDDISLPHRVTTMVAHWIAKRPAILYSASNVMDVDGRFLRLDQSADSKTFECAAYFPDRAVTVAQGCAAAYARDFLQSVALPAQPVWAEDYYLSLVALLTGNTIGYVREPLVSYRQNPKAMRNFTAENIDFLSYEHREMAFFDGMIVLLCAFADLVDSGCPAAQTRVERDMIARDIGWYRYRADWARRSFFARLCYTATLRSGQRLRWSVPRIVGINTFILMKTLLTRLNQSMKSNH